ncbi:ribokinase [Paenibacillus marinisediminis]
MNFDHTTCNSADVTLTHKRPRITVIGSLNMDLVTITNIVPQAGETVSGESFFTLCGGKGANQAVACARLGAEVHMLGCVGNDSFGADMIHNLERQSVNCEQIRKLDGVSSGIAVITIADGDNRIIVVPGANGQLKPAAILEQEKLIAESDLVLLQLEIPLETVAEAIRIAAKHRVPTMLNPAPADQLTPELMNSITWLTPNEHELKLMFAAVSNDEAEESDAAYHELLSRMPERIIMTKGGDGALWCNADGVIRHTNGHKVEVVDTTGAGDTFNGALAVALAEGRSLPEAVEWAVAAGALSVTKFGAQGGMPLRSELDEWMTKR